jgi:O-antigen/teichoic acid export membrane protein
MVLEKFFGRDAKEIAFGTLSALIVKLLAIACVFLMNLVIVRQIGAYEAGIFFLCLAAISFLANIGRLGLDKSVVRFVSVANSGEDRASVHLIYRKALLWVTFSCVTFGVLLFIFKGPISEKVFGKPFLEPVLTLMAFAVPLVGLYTLHASSLQGLKRIAPAMATLSLVVPFITLLALLAFGASNAVDTAEIYLAACALTLCVGYFAWYRSTPRVKAEGSFSSVELRRSCIPLWGAVFCNQIVTWSSLLLLGVWGSAEDVGFFAIAQRTALLTSLVLIATNAITAPKLAVLSAHKKPEELVRVARLSVRFALSGAIPGLLLIVIWPQWLMGLFGEEFVGAALALVILAIGQFVNNATGQVQGILSMSGNEIKVSQNLAVSAVVSITLGFVLIPTYGLIGAAIAQAVSVASQNILGVVQIKRIFGFNIMYFWRSAR